MTKSMAASSCSSSSSSTAKTSLSPHHPPHFTPIEEGNEDEEFSQGRTSFRATTPASDNADPRDGGYHPTPLNSESNATASAKSSASTKSSTKKRLENSHEVSCNKCRPSNREKISVVPLENNGNGSGQRLSIASPNGLFKSILSSLAMKRSPRLPDDARDEHWKIVVAELSNKLVQATRKRDEAILESSKLKHSMAELEKKLNKLEIYCHTLKSGLEVCSNNNNNKSNNQQPTRKSPSRVDYRLVRVGDRERVVEHFLISVSESRSTVRALTRALSLHLRQMGGKVHERVSALLQPYDVRVSFSRNPRGLLFYLEALLNQAFYEDFESPGFQKSGPNPILNPIDRCEANFAMFTRLQGLTWDEVLSKGTRHFSEDFSRFCDRKMSEIVAMLGWNRAWPEPLLQAFFGASKAVWLVHLLANSVHPGLPVFRVDKGVGFDPVYMEDMGGERARKLVPNVVRIMVMPGFYVYDNVVKCKVLCRYYNSNHGSNFSDFYDKGFTPSPSTLELSYGQLEMFEEVGCKSGSVTKLMYTVAWMAWHSFGCILKSEGGVTALGTSLIVLSKQANNVTALGTSLIVLSKQANNVAPNS
ncbi:hypothetical protein STAS_03751 [Striga asiatica]|uniref:GIL1/IRKI C-terminal domain-containing protein n=1 Tax=Striga asiatica TaxID=4170 RepID=A0A5A7P512_STRAF|nr:hypothetical protein STAS_03751 [Striga asiatica]